MEIERLRRDIRKHFPKDKRDQALKVIDKLKSQSLSPKEFGMLRDTNIKINDLYRKFQQLEAWENSEEFRDGASDH